VIRDLNRVLRDELAPQVSKVREDYLLVVERYDLASNGLNLRLPSRALNENIRLLVYKQGASSQSEQEVQIVWPGERINYRTESGRPLVAQFRGRFLEFFGSAQGVVDLYFKWKPSELVSPDDYRQITAVSTTTNPSDTITLDSAVPSGWTNSNTFDLQCGDGGGEPLDWDLSATTVAGTSIVFTRELGSVFGRTAPEAGDYVALVGKCAVPQVPEGLHGVLAHGAAVRIAQAQSDIDALRILKPEYLQNLQNQVGDLERRADMKRPIVNHNSRFRRYRRQFFRLPRRLF